MKIFLTIRTIKFIILFIFLIINIIEPVNSKTDCKKSITTVNGVKSKCKNEVIFEEYFDRIYTDDDYAREDNYRFLNSTIWQREIKIPLEPDYEFCVYHTLEKGLKVENGILKITPSLLDDSYGENITYFGRLQLAGCTGTFSGECLRKAVGFSILPPILSTRLITQNSFTFCYGKIQIRAKFPEGDWLYPEMWLQPKYTTHGIGYLSGRVILGMVRGNENLKNVTDSSQDFGAKRLEFGLRTGPSENVTDEKVIKEKEFDLWTRNFHTYTTTWNKEGFKFEVDGEVVGHLRQQPKKATNQNIMAPYDLEFYLTLGVGVGGIRVFPDKVKSGYYQKPWKNVGAKAMYHFWEAKDQWLPNWQRDNRQKIALEVDYVKIWSV